MQRESPPQVQGTLPSLDLEASGCSSDVVEVVGAVVMVVLRKDVRWERFGSQCILRIGRFQYNESKKWDEVCGSTVSDRTTALSSLDRDWVAAP